MSIGANVLAQYVRDEGRLLDWHDRAKPKASLVMDSPALARKIKMRLPQSHIIHRTYNINDPHWHDRKADGSWVFPPGDWLDAHAATVGNSGVILQVFNEPNPINLYAFLSWLEELVHLATLANITLGIGAFGVGNPYEKDIEGGKWDRLIRLISGTKHFLLLHEYYHTDPSSEFPWLCGRVTYWVERAQALGLTPLKIIISEHGRDYGGGNNDGYRGQGWSAGRMMTALAWVQKHIYGPLGISVCVYCWGYGANNDWWSFDFQDDTELQELIVGFNQENTVSYPNLPLAADTRWQAVVASSGGLFVNVRSTPVVDGIRNKVGEIRANTPVEIVTDEALGYADGAGVWRPIKLPDGVIGWARDDVFTWKTSTAEKPEGTPVSRTMALAMNVREQPTTRSAVLGTLSMGAPVLVTFTPEPVMSDGYLWAWVQYIDLAGWVARVKPAWDDELLDESAATLLSIPYVSQWGWASGRTGMCGEAAAWSVLAEDRIRRGLDMPKEITVDSIADYLGLGLNSLTTMEQLADALEAYGVYPIISRSLSLDKIRSELDQGNPVICLIRYGDISNRADRNYTGGHILTAIGHSDSHIICHDPDYSGTAGANVRYANSDMQLALVGMGNVGILIRFYPAPEEGDR